MSGNYYCNQHLKFKINSAMLKKPNFAGCLWLLERRDLTKLMRKLVDLIVVFQKSLLKIVEHQLLQMHQHYSPQFAGYAFLL